MAKQRHGEADESPRADSKTESRRRLKSLAISRGLLSRGPSRPPSRPLRPSVTVLKHRGKDIVKKGHRKGRFLFSLPGLLAPFASGGRIGELADLSTGNPVLYLDFPNGRLKLFGTILYPKNRYLSLRFAKKNVLCEDFFDSMVIFSDAWWIGTKEENPQEVKLKFPEDQIQDKDVDCEFRGGAGSATEERMSGDMLSQEYMEPLSPDAELKHDISEDFYLDRNNHSPDKMQITPIRQSARTSQKTLNYAEHSSEDDSISSDTNASDNSNKQIVSAVANNSGVSENIQSKTQGAEEVKLSPSTKVAGESSKSKSVLVQTTVSSLFQKVREKKTKHSVEKSHEQKGVGSGAKRQRASKKLMPNIVQTPNRQGTARKKTGSQKQPTRIQVEDDDDIEDVSSDSEDLDDSDEDWAA